MFKRILIANRGEIAMRVIRACRELGIRTVAIYAECDATAIFVKKADEAHLVGPGPMQGFLDMQAIVDLAKRSGADGIHPGYGFLSENADFAKLCETSGITFIGPSPEAIRLMGNKVQAREIARKAGVPIVPGTEKSVTNPTEALSFAARRERRDLPGEVHRAAAPHRVPDPRRQAREHHPPGRAGLLDPAPAPEADRDRALAGPR